MVPGANRYIIDASVRKIAEKEKAADGGTKNTLGGYGKTIGPKNATTEIDLLGASLITDEKKEKAMKSAT